METGILLSIQVGRPQLLMDFESDVPGGRPFSTAIVKRPVKGPIRLAPAGLEGDRQADRENHGGPDKAVLAYCAEHYPDWIDELHLPDMPYGGFGENLTISGLDERSVCIGDTFAIGEVRLRVSQPRQPCWKLARRWKVKDLPLRVNSKRNPGWYLRVLQGGELLAGTQVEVVDRPYPDWTVRRAIEAMLRRGEDRAEAGELAAISMLATAWREALISEPGR
ncbi:MOSC domain-containing protein [Candidatus Sumerlaeota bacterium]|nr:MOSC domain-containing protein [Candidatus Sumerlaeota bacterium]